MTTTLSNFGLVFFEQNIQMNPRREKTLLIESEDIKKIVDHFGLDFIVDGLLEKLEFALGSFDAKKTIVPARSGFQYETPNYGLIEWMPVNKNGDRIVLKIVGYHPNNPEKYKLPTIISSISAYDTETGHLLGIIDGVFLTALRTGAASAIASKYLAKKESTTIGIIGCGAQSVTQLHFLSRLFNVTKVLVYDSNSQAANSLAKRCDFFNFTVPIEVSSIKTIVNNSDILCTCTSIEPNQGPLFDNLTSKEHLHINAVGSDFPGKIEIPKSILQNSQVIPDFIDQAIIEGECQQLTKEQIGPDWIEIIQQNEKYSDFKDKRTVFDSTGWALEDLVVFDMFMELAEQIGVGKDVQIENYPSDAKNPYSILNPEPSKRGKRTNLLPVNQS